ncbi:thermonuclease family protein [Rhizobium sp. CG5]|uniref:thermonuclease family protein n=1 Tax=Rhizobium sp. CG5 TaxID=2726076 RepID=UPI002033F2D5|nr:thermonuclease family protein [Rhizobium sp. CG5]MCM2472709.1 thermonuclease family protein [Rhizobium sp. CG5]
MRPVGTFFTGLAGLGLWCLALVYLAADLREVPDIANEEASIQATTETPPAQASIIENRPVRPISPDAFASPVGTTDTTGFERITPRQDPAPAKPELAAVLPRPQTIDAGRLAFGARTLQLRGVQPTDRQRLCPGSDGTQWPCGMVARTQQRLFLRNRSVTCDIASANWTGTIVAACRIGDTDIAEWLIRNGWAEAAGDQALMSLSEAARSAKLGLYGDDPR